MLKLTREIARNGKTFCGAGLLALAVAASGLAQDASRLKVTLTPSIATPALVGQQVMWKAAVTGGSGRITYRFASGPAGSSLSVKRDFSTVSTLPWSELTEGVYHVLVEVRSTGGGVGKAGAVFVFNSRVLAGSPVVSTTANPLVALYSAPVCTSGSTVQVMFWPVGMTKNQITTPAQSCNGKTSLNFYLAGMTAETTYEIQQNTTTGGNSTTGPQLSFKTGAVSYKILPFKVTVKPTKKTSAAEDVLLMSFKAVKNSPPLYPTTAVDLNGNVVWYYLDPENTTTPQSEYLTRPVAGGTFITLMWGGAIREVDLAGNIVRETNVLRIAEQLRAKGTDQIDWLSHEALRLPNGHTVTLGSAERILTTQGPNPVDVVGDLIIDLDENFQVSWSWSSFDHLNTHRVAPLNEKCGQSGNGGVDSCGHLKLATTANDWTHANSLLLTSDQNLLLSIRDQDWVVKVDYSTGTGDGHVIWALGPDGACAASTACNTPAFSIGSGASFYQDAFPWFSHQHDVEFDGTNYELYDNGNTRVSSPTLGAGGLGSGNSRGYVFSVDESTMTVNVVHGWDLNSFSPGFGSAQFLSNGDYTFTNGTINDALFSQVVEIPADGNDDFKGTWKSRSYRSFRLVDLYTYTQ